MDFSLDLGRQFLAQTPETLRSLLGSLGPEWLEHAEAEGAWTPYQVVAHLTFVEETDWIDRTHRFLERNPAAILRPVDREGGFARYEGWPLGRILDHFAEVRRQNLDALASEVTPADLDLEATHPTFGPVTLGNLLATWAAHDCNHLGQIVKTLAKQYGDAVGPWRVFLPILDAR